MEMEFFLTECVSVCEQMCVCVCVKSACTQCFFFGRVKVRNLIMIRVFDHAQNLPTCLLGWSCIVFLDIEYCTNGWKLMEFYLALCPVVDCTSVNCTSFLISTVFSSFRAAAPKGSMTYAFTYMVTFLLLLLLRTPPLESQSQGPRPKF